MVQVSRLDHLSDGLGRSLCLFVRKVYCGKTAEQIRIPFGVVSGVGRGMGVLYRGPRTPSGRAVSGILASICFSSIG